MNKEFSIVVFGLKERQDRWQRCEEIIKREGFQNVTRCATTKDLEDLHRHSVKDFLRMLEAKRGSDILFFEDDFELTEGWREVFKEALKELPRNFDLLYLGANLTTTPVVCSKNLLKVNGAWMVHAVLISRNFIEYILKEYDINRERVFDDWLRKIAPYRNFYMTYPMISYQRAGYSDFANKETDYDIFNNKFYKNIRV